MLGCLSLGFPAVPIWRRRVCRSESHVCIFCSSSANILPNSNAVKSFRARAHHTVTYLGVSTVCGSVISNGGVPATSGCNMACDGDAAHLCGGPNRVGSFSREVVPTVLSLDPSSISTTTPVALKQRRHQLGLSPPMGFGRLQVAGREFLVPLI